MAGIRSQKRFQTQRRCGELFEMVICLSAPLAHFYPEERTTLTNIVIRSDEANAAATSLLLAARGHTVCLWSSKISAGVHHFNCLGEQRTVTLGSVNELDVLAPTVGIVYAEGEDVRAGIRDVFGVAKLDLLVIVGGGISASVQATEAAQTLDFDVARVLHVGGFLVGGNATAVKSEKQGVMAGFLAPGTATQVRELAVAALPQISVGDGLSVALSSVNALVHLPPMIFNAMSVERGDDIRFYVEGFGESVSRLIAALDADRLRLGAELGFMLTPVAELMDRTRGPGGMPGRTLREKVNAFPSFQSIKLPSNLRHRFLEHELQSTFAPMSELARIVDIDVPTIDSVTRIGEVLLEADLTSAAKPIADAFFLLTKSRTPSDGIPSS